MIKLRDALLMMVPLAFFSGGLVSLGLHRSAEGFWPPAVISGVLAFFFAMAVGE